MAESADNLGVRGSGDPVGSGRYPGAFPLAEGALLSTPASETARRADVSVAVLGSGEVAAALVRSLASVEGVTLSGVWTPKRDTASGTAAETLGVDVVTDLSSAARDPRADIVIDASGDERTNAALRALMPPGVQLIGSGGVRLLARMFTAGGGEGRRMLADLRLALERVQAQERRLMSSKATLERSNRKLDRELAEMYFMHEFFKGLTGFVDPGDVCSLIVDAAAGMFGVASAAVYLVDRTAGVFVREVVQGMSESAVRSGFPVGESVLGEALRAGRAVQVMHASGTQSSWMHGGADLWHVAAPLCIGENTLAVLVLVEPRTRALDDAELVRLRAMCDQAALALQNALLHRELERLSATDRLTGLANRGYLEERLDTEVSRASRYGRPLSLIMIDIDDFKSFNDSFGHPAGDALLREVSAVVRQNLRDMDVAARYGGEEFVLVLPETDAEGAVRVAQRVREEVSEVRVDVGAGARAGRTISVGVSTFPRDAADSASLVQSADDAMYAAKRTGKNRVEAASQPRHDANEGEPLQP